MILPNRKLAKKSRAEPLHIRGAYSLTGERQLPATGERHPLRREMARWLVWGAAAALCLGLGVTAPWVWWARRDSADPSGRTVKIVRESMKFYPGAYGPLRVMPQLAIENGTDAREQRASRARSQPPVAPRQEPIPPAERGEIVPPQSPARQTADASAASDADLGDVDAVEMHLPAQMNPCFVLDRLVRPEYPLEADAQARAQRAISVEAAFYVSETGAVTGAYILQSSGLPLFDDVVLRAVNQWRFKPVTDPACPGLGFWVRLPVIFRSHQKLIGR